jgi:hypothetical protein
MRPSSGFSNVLIALLLLATASCASAPPSVTSKETFELKGSLSIEGDQPFDRAIVLVDSNKVKWRLDPGSLEAELSLLAGYEVVLTCSGIPGMGSEMDARVTGYKLVPPEGLAAILGNIRSEDGSVMLEAEEGEYRLIGPLSSALEAFLGNRAWIWGSLDRDGAIEVSGYEVIGP